MNTSDEIEELIAAAGEATEQPPNPPGGIPQQKVPSWIRWTVRALILPWIILDIQMQKIAKKLIRPPFKAEGGCLKRGNCCHYILLPKAKGLLGRIFLLWNTEFNGFYLGARIYTWRMTNRCM